MDSKEFRWYRKQGNSHEIMNNGSQTGLNWSTQMKIWVVESYNIHIAQSHEFKLARTSSAWGRIATDTALVWTRPDFSVTGTLCQIKNVVISLGKQIAC